MKFKLLIALYILFFFGCKSSQQMDIEGYWVINEFKYNNEPVEFRNLNLKIELLPVGYSDKRTLQFNKDSTCIMPGINTEDVVLKWKLNNDTLIIKEDTNITKAILFESIEHLNSTLFEGENIQENQKKYKRLKDSIEFNKNNHPYIKALKIYSGKYLVSKVDDSHINLYSEKSKVRLVDVDKEMSKKAREILR